MRLSLAEQIQEISQVAPKDLDPDALHFEEQDGQGSGQAAATEHYLLELGSVAFFFLALYLPSVIVVRPHSARPRTACRI